MKANISNLERVIVRHPQQSPGWWDVMAFKLKTSCDALECALQLTEGMDQATRTSIVSATYDDHDADADSEDGQIEGEESDVSE